MNDEIIEAKLSQIPNPVPENRDFRLNLKKRLMNQLEYAQNEAVRAKQMNAMNAVDGQNGSASNNGINSNWSTENHSKIPGFFGRLGLSGLVFSVFIVFSLSSVMAYYSFPTVKNTVNKIVSIKEKGKIVINTTPDDATIFINGKEYGNSPLEEKLEVGNYAVKISKEGYKNYYQTVEIKNDKTLNLDITLEGVVSQDTYANWLVYNNTEKGFGFRYPGSWTISEQDKSGTNSTSSKDGNFVVNLKNDYANIALNYSNVKPKALASDIPVRKLDLGNCVFDVGYENKNETGTGAEAGSSVGTDTGTEAENNNAISFDCVLNSKDLYLSVGATITTQGGLSETSAEYTELKNMLASVWLDKTAIAKHYETPTTKASAKFVWQQKDTVYAMGTTGSLPMSKFDFKGNSIGKLSPDYKWITFVEPSGISIIDNEGNNYQKLITIPTTVATQDGKKYGFDLSLSNGGWSNDMRFFLYGITPYDLSTCSNETCDVTGEMGAVLSEASGVKRGLYVFNFNTGKSTYLKDSVDGFLANWSNDSKYIYMAIDEESAAGQLREYFIEDLASYKDYKLDNAGEIDALSMQFDVYDRDNVVLRMNDLKSAGSKTVIAKLTNGKINVLKDLSNVDWTQAEWPRYSQYKEFIIFNGINYYDVKSNVWETLNGADKYKYDFVAYNTNYSVLAADTIEKTGNPVPSTMNVIDLRSNTLWENVWAADKQGKSATKDDSIAFPGINLN